MFYEIVDDNIVTSGNLCVNKTDLQALFDSDSGTMQGSVLGPILYALFNLYKILTIDVPSFEKITVLDQIICTRRQITFQIFKNNSLKIGMNTTANKLYQLSNLISLEQLNRTFYQYKILAKVQFLKYGNT